MQGATPTQAEAVPAARRHIIKRPRLTRLLDESTARIIMLVAPAGYGKTTLAREWLSQNDRRFAWYHADSSSRDIAAFAIGIRDAIRQLLPDVGEAMETHLRASSSPEAKAHVLAELLIADLGPWPADAWLAIDDYQLAALSEACEVFTDALGEAGIRLMLTSRKRPSWATAKRRVYGHYTEVGPAELTLTGEEVRAILGSGDASTLVQVGRGWPAIVGLAALAGGSSVATTLAPDTGLYDYLAEELYRAASPMLRHAVTLLAVAPNLSTEIAAALLGDDHAAILREASAAGFLTFEHNNAEMHPLIRDFLQLRLQSREADQKALVRRVAGTLMELRLWDDAFAVTTELGHVELMDDLIRHSLQPLLDENRLGTIVDWTGRARKEGFASTVVELAEAEVVFRRGHHGTADELARAVVEKIAKSDRMRPRALLLAARAAHFVNRSAEAFDRATDAYATAREARTRSDAAWVRVNVAYELERDDIEQLLAEFGDVTEDSYTRTIRILNGRAQVASLNGCLTDVLVSAGQVIELAKEVNDPMVRTSFYSQQTSLLVSAGRYEAAATVVEAMLAYARHAQLEFVFPYAYSLLAAAQVGLGAFDAAEDSVVEALRRAPGDPYVEVHSRYVRARMLLAQQRFDEAEVLTSARPRLLPWPASLGEYFAVHGVALACLGRLDRALAVAVQVEATTRAGEARCVAEAVRAIVGWRRGDDTAPLAFYNMVVERGAFDTLVTAYRAEPSLLRPMLKAHLGEELRALAAGSRDIALLDRIQAQVSELSLLTRREQEVLALLGDGRTNREIAAALVISEVTAKVHVRHILEKLGVQSRTQAALKAARLLANRPEQ